MKITGFELAELNIALKKPFITSLRRVDAICDIIIAIHTDSRHTGYGEACAVTAITGTTNKSVIEDLEKRIFPILLGTDVDERDSFSRLHACQASPEAKACVDIALYDLLAKQAGKSLYNYLGAANNMLKTDLTISVNDASIMQQESLKALELGFDTLKVKLDSDVSKNIARIDAINDIIPDNVRLRLDPNQALDLNGCLDMLQRVKTANIECIEQPFDAKDIDAMKILKEKGIVPVLADESVFDLQDARRLLEEKAADMLNIKLMKCAGVNKALEIAQLAREHEKSCMIGSMLEGPISLLAAVHFGLSQSNIQMADLDSPLYLKEHPLLEPFHLHHDTIQLSSDTGLGIDAIMKKLNCFPSV